MLLKILLWQSRSWRQVDLAEELGLSQTEVNFAIHRLARSGLLDASKKRPMKLALAEFLIHGLRYVYPAELGGMGRGVVTAHSHDSLARNLVVGEGDRIVWPDPQGDARGQMLEPLYPSVPFAARKDAELHEWLALIDAVRIGSVRARNLAAERIRDKIRKAAA
ncbi:MAG: hypothetical protein IT285_03435 [Bdellovibrionales bacterium]|nr:hypothetical protein [Bdellovibrionales bacterium]